MVASPNYRQRPVRLRDAEHAPSLGFAFAFCFAFASPLRPFVPVASIAGLFAATAAILVRKDILAIPVSHLAVSWQL